VDKYLLPAVALMIVVSLVPVALELRRRRRTAATSPRPPRPVA
jgi:membrane-associated protein